MGKFTSHDSWNAHPNRWVTRGLAQGRHQRVVPKKGATSSSFVAPKWLIISFPMKMQWLGLDLFSYIYYIQYDETVILLKRVLVYLLYPMVISNMMQYIYMWYTSFWNMNCFFNHQHWGLKVGLHCIFARDGNHIENVFLKNAQGKNTYFAPYVERHDPIHPRNWIPVKLCSNLDSLYFKVQKTLYGYHWIRLAFDFFWYLSIHHLLEWTPETACLDWFHWDLWRMWIPWAYLSWNRFTNEAGGLVRWVLR